MAAYAGRTHTGRRQNNEDSFLMLELDKETYCFAVADGMGGSEGGEIASHLVITSIEQYLTYSYRAGLFQTEKIKEILIKACYKAQESLKNEILMNPSLSGMGTTLTIILIQNKHYVWANIGDSRIYLLRNNNSFSQITIDHSLVEEYRQKHGKIDSDFAENYGNVITRSLGGTADAIDFFPIHGEYETIQNDTIFLLCTDGLLISKQKNPANTFADIVYNSANAEEAINQLIDYAYNAGSSDNITAIIASFGINFPAHKETKSKGKSKAYSGKSSHKAMKRFDLINIIIIGTIIGLLIVIYPVAKNLYHSFQSAQIKSKGTISSDNSFNNDSLATNRSQSLADHKKERPKVHSAAEKYEYNEFVWPTELTLIKKILATYLNDSGNRKNQMTAFLVIKRKIMASKPDYLTDAEFITLTSTKSIHSRPCNQGNHFKTRDTIRINDNNKVILKLDTAILIKELNSKGLQREKLRKIKMDRTTRLLASLIYDRNFNIATLSRTLKENVSQLTLYKNGTLYQSAPLAEQNSLAYKKHYLKKRGTLFLTSINDSLLDVFQMYEKDNNFIIKVSYKEYSYE